MRRLSIVFLLLVTAWPLSASNSREIQAAAEAEIARRKKLAKPAPVYTNVTGPALASMMGPPRPSPSTPGASPTPEVLPAAEDTVTSELDESATATLAGTPTPTPTPSPRKHDELYWRERMAEADKRIVELEKDLEWARQKLFVVQVGLIVPNDANREFIRKVEHDGLLAETARLEAELEDARAEPERIREEGRRERARPGWFR